MPPRKRTRSKHVKPSTPPKPAKPFRAEPTPAVTLPTAPPAKPIPPREARKNRLLALIAQAVDSAIPMRPLHSLITEYAEYLGVVGDWPMWNYTTSATLVDDTRLIGIRTPPPSSFGKGVSPFLVNEHGITILKGGWCLPEARICVTPERIYLATKRVIYGLWPESPNPLVWFAGDLGNAGYEEKGADCDIRSSRFGEIQDLISNHDGSALIVADWDSQSIRRISDEKIQTICHRGSDRPVLPLGNMRMTLDRSCRFGGVDMCYFTLGSVVEDGLRGICLFRVGTDKSSESTRVRLSPQPFDSPQHGLACTPNGTVIVYNIPHGSLYAVDPGSGVVEQFENPSPHHIDTPPDWDTWNDYISMRCETGSEAVQIWNRYTKRFRVTLPVEFWEKPPA